MAGTRRRDLGDPTTGIRSDLASDYAVPGLDEALAMHDVKYLKVRRHGKLILDLKINDDIIIIPSGVDNDLPVYISEIQTWKGKIKAIKKQRESKERWLIVAWYYSPSEFQGLNAPDSKQNDFGSKELVFVSTHLDVIHWETVDGQAPIAMFEEEDIELDEIPESYFYCRGVWDDRKEKWLKKRPAATCICRHRYKLHEDGLMHFCPRPYCHKWYHADCLEQHKWIDADLTEIEIELQWEMSLDIDEKHSTLAESIPHAPLRNMTVHGRAPDPYSFIPDDLLKLARQPIIRGGDYGAIGNAAVVLRARVIVDRVARHGEELLDDWREHVWLREKTTEVPGSNPNDAAKVKNALLNAGGGEHFTAGGNKIPRHSVPDFWHRIKDGFEVSYKCPGCGNVI
ncbi:hypothetical protein CALVIDRAFT_108517 [Calocera viscosa TUFC12733]|uniref:BAH domain-containing protein n=1 Tax=Calocera viscosa (strain TUFC12733) TaxID=1330018 RepID=A0A167MDF7_CALVF|nr:hypothetical protein CALVIDRAFT_108517 [Calocera viscosa TUFC12733]